MNFVELVAVPLGVVTVIKCIPSGTADETSAEILLSLATLKLTGVFPILTSVVPLKFCPVMVIVSPSYP